MLAAAPRGRPGDRRANPAIGRAGWSSSVSAAPSRSSGCAAHRPHLRRRAGRRRPGLRHRRRARARGAGVDAARRVWSGCSASPPSRAGCGAAIWSPTACSALSCCARRSAGGEASARRRWQRVSRNSPPTTATRAARLREPDRLAQQPRRADHADRRHREHADRRDVGRQQAHQLEIGGVAEDHRDEHRIGQPERRRQAQRGEVGPAARAATSRARSAARRSAAASRSAP